MRALVAGLPALVAALVVLPGLGARDLAGDEIHMLVGDPVEILRWSLDPREPFFGHLPLSYWMRQAALSLLGEESALAWRLHAAVGAAGAAALTALVPRRPGMGLLAGLLVALSPVLAFHGQDSSNYAWTALTGALLLLGLRELRERPWVLSLALGLGVLNDLYFGLAAAPALIFVIRAWRQGQPLRQMLPLVPALLLAALVLTLLSARLLLGGETGAIAFHADPAPPSSLPVVLEVPLRLLNRVGGSYLWGYAAGRATEPWEALPPMLVLVLLLALAAWKGRAPAGQAARLALGGLGLAILAGILFRLGLDRVLPQEPRVFLSLLPAMAIAAAGALERLPRPARLGATLLLLLLSTEATLRQGLDRSTLHRDAARRVAEGLAPGELVVAEQRLRWRLLAEGVDPERILPCLNGPAQAPGLWWIRLQPLDQPLDHRGCMQGDGTQPVLSLDPLQPVDSWTAGPPDHERSAASFLMPAVVIRYRVPNEERPTRAGIGIERRLLDGLDGAVLTALVEGQSVAREPLSPEDGLSIALPEQLPALLELRAHRPLPPGIPRWTLFDPLRRDIQRWEPLPLVPTLDEPRWTLRAAPFREPWLQVGRRLGTAVLVLLLLAGLRSADPGASRGAQGR